MHEELELDIQKAAGGRRGRGRRDDLHWREILVIDMLPLLQE